VSSFGQLLASPGVSERVELAGPFGVLAFHGGLEGGTAEVAEAVAHRSGASLYQVVQPGSLLWHIPSHRVDPADSPSLAAFLDHVQFAMAIHGYGRFDRPRDVLLGGRNRALARHVATHLRQHLAGFRVIDNMADVPVEMRGLHHDNPVNRPAGTGVQVELPPLVRGASPRAADRGQPCVPRPELVEGLAAAAATWTG